MTGMLYSMYKLIQYDTNSRILNLLRLCSKAQTSQQVVPALSLTTQCTWAPSVSEEEQHITTDAFDSILQLKNQHEGNRECILPFLTYGKRGELVCINDGTFKSIGKF